MSQLEKMDEAGERSLNASLSHFLLLVLLDHNFITQKTRRGATWPSIFPFGHLSLQSAMVFCSACCPRGPGSRVSEEAAAGMPRELKEAWLTLLIARHTSRLIPVARPLHLSRATDQVFSCEDPEDDVGPYIS